MPGIPKDGISVQKQRALKTAVRKAVAHVVVANADPRGGSQYAAYLLFPTEAEADRFEEVRKTAYPIVTGSHQTPQGLYAIPYTYDKPYPGEPARCKRYREVIEQTVVDLNIMSLSEIYERKGTEHEGDAVDRFRESLIEEAGEQYLSVGPASRGRSR